MRPPEVARAVVLLSASLALGVVIPLLDRQYLASVAPPRFTVAVLAVVLGVVALLVLGVRGGRNWARVGFLVLFLLGVVPYVSSVTAMFRRSVLVGVLSLAQMVLQACALYLIFTKPGAGWFRRGARERS